MAFKPQSLINRTNIKTTENNEEAKINKKVIKKTTKQNSILVGNQYKLTVMSCKQCKGEPKNTIKKVIKPFEEVIVCADCKVIISYK